MRRRKRVFRTRKESIDRLFMFSVENREKPTAAEKQFETLLYQVRKYIVLSQNMDLGNINSQQVITSNTAKTGYIIDFTLPRINLAFEIDGPYHENRKEYDKLREAYINTKGLTIIRYTNNEVFKDGMRDRLREDIKAYLKEKYPKGHADLFILPKVPYGTYREFFYSSHMKERHLMR